MPPCQVSSGDAPTRRRSPVPVTAATAVTGAHDIAQSAARRPGLGRRRIRVAGQGRVRRWTTTSPTSPSPVATCAHTTGTNDHDTTSAASTGRSVTSAGATLRRPWARCLSATSERVVVQAAWKSNGLVELIPIGEAAHRLGLRASALRYYDERGLVTPRSRRGGTRMYGPDELRRLAFLSIAHRLGIPLDTAAAVLDAPGPDWRSAVRDQLHQLDRLLDQVRGAQTFLEHALDCPTEHPARDCPTMTAALDRLLTGISVEQLGREQGPLPSPRQPG